MPDTPSDSRPAVHPAADALARLQAVLDTLIGPDGCPWDRTQTPESLCDYVVEESFELVEAIRDHDPEATREELGDVLFLLLFIATRLDRPTTAPEAATNAEADAPAPAPGHPALAEALELETAKMIRRHPHVFGDLEVNSRQELLRNWERIKREEKADCADAAKKRTFASLPKGLPPLLRAYRIHAKAARVGFTWPDDAAVAEQYQREWAELDAARASGEAAAIEEEYGDCLFTLVELGRRLGIKANAALDRANRKFLTRFGRMEDLAEARGIDMTGLDLAALDQLWNEAKSLKD